MARDRTARGSSSAQRLWRLTGMTTSIASRVAGHQVKRLFQGEEAIRRDRERLMRDVGRQVAETLGEMKGAVMKVGQIASQMQDLLPKEISDALAVLQKASAPLPFSVIRGQLRRQLGADIDTLFRHIDETPFAAASIGQVHRATTLDGREVVVKVQYPAVRESIASDMRHLRRILRLGSLFKVRPETLDAIFAEIRDQLEEELDYEREADNIRRFREFHRDDDWVVIPEVVDQLSSGQVLTLVYEPGDDLETVASSPAYPQDIRNLIGERIYTCIGRQMFGLRAVHCDPHPGNFAFRPDGTLVIYDFGAIKRLSEDDLRAMRALMHAAYTEDYDALERALVALEIRTRGGPDVDRQFYRDWLYLLRAPFDAEPFDFGNSRLHSELLRLTRGIPWRYLESFQPSARTLLVNRVFGGHYWTLVKLGVKGSFRPHVEAAMAALQAAA